MSDASPQPANDASKVPLCVDLDGTLIATDSLWESMVELVKSKPIAVVSVPFWLLRGKAGFKQRVSESVDLDPASLPYRPEVLEQIEAARQQGRRVLLATAASERIAQGVATHLACFDGVISTRAGVNCSGEGKAAAIRSTIGAGGFEYIGDSHADLPVWEAASVRTVVSPSRSLRHRMNRRSAPFREIDVPRGRLKPLLSAMRLHHWVKNVLLFVPLVAAHRMTDVAAWTAALIAFFAFGLCASSVYIVNDLLDLKADRAHPHKSARPFASGRLPIWVGPPLAVALMAAGATLALTQLPLRFAEMLAIYLVLSNLYSINLKKRLGLDAVVLASLYTLRVVMGGEAMRIEISPWLLMFSIFLFLSLAFAKRYSEVSTLRARGQTSTSRRGYRDVDADLICSLGSTSGYLAVLVLALYITGDQSRLLYAHPRYLWLACPLLLYWLTRLWFITRRGEMHHDPVVFAMRDRVSWLVGALLVALLWMSI